MKIFLFLLFLLFTTNSQAQLSFPKGFKLIAGENPSGEDDIYTNGRYSFQVHEMFRSYDQFERNDEKFKNYVSDSFGFSFYRTRDGLCWGTGKKQGIYSYVVVSWDGEAFELYSSYNDSGFSDYSKWLLRTLRDYHKQGKNIMFPSRHNEKSSSGNN